MRICYPKVEFLPDQGLLKNIELAGRVCYKSENHITDTSALAFVNMIKDREHLSVLEHGSVYLKVPTSKLEELKIVANDVWCFIIPSPYNQETNDGYSFVYTNLRYIQESNPELAQILIYNEALPEGVEYFTPEKNDPYKRYSFRIITNFKISEQYVRHRVFSHSKESSRYCNYAKKKFNNEISIVVPIGWAPFFNELTGTLEGIDEKWYLTPDKQGEELEEICRDNRWTLEKDSSGQSKIVFDFLGENYDLHKILSRCKLAEMDYMEAINNGSRPEDARDFLTLFTKTEQVMTGYLKDWQDLVRKRSIPGAQFEARWIADRIRAFLRRETSGRDDFEEEVIKIIQDSFRMDNHVVIPEPIFQ